MQSLESTDAGATIDTPVRRFWRKRRTVGAGAEDYQKEFTVLARLGGGRVNSGVAAAQTRIEEAAREMAQAA